jgi:hypothetical protein
MNRLLLTLGLLAGNTAFLAAGPSTQFPVGRAGSNNAAVAKSATPPAMACPMCKTVAVTEASFANTSGKIAPRSTPVGTEHACAGCTGTVRVVRSQATDEMKRNCPVCAPAAANSCNAAPATVAAK